MVFCIGFATMKYLEGLVVVGMEGGTLSCFSLAGRIDPLTRDCRAETGRILVSYTQKGATRPVLLAQLQLGP
jgi:hypothetical protein